jgi:hypothetical protein
MRGLVMCGKHAKVKNQRIWSEICRLDKNAVFIQKIWRGYSVRWWLQLAGPGVLKRSICHNEEELVTLDEKTSTHPFDYFAFEENGNVYWFDIRSIAENSNMSIEPTNPYTREPLSLQTRKRLRHLCIRRYRRQLYNFHDIEKKVSPDEKLMYIWIYICQVITENGFFDMSPLYFTSLNKSQLLIFNYLVLRDLKAWLAEHKTMTSRRGKYVLIVKGLINEYHKVVSDRHYSYLTGRTIISMLEDCPENYPICFMLMSALHRL